MTERSSWKRREKVNILVRPCHFLTTICSYTTKKLWWIKDRKAVQNSKRIGKNAINKITKNPWWVWHFLPGDFLKMRFKSNATNERCLKVIIKALFRKDDKYFRRWWCFPSIRRRCVHFGHGQPFCSPLMSSGTTKIKWKDPWSVPEIAKTIYSKLYQISMKPGRAQNYSSKSAIFIWEGGYDPFDNFLNIPFTAV